MTKERFQALAEAYGAQISSWPVELREEAVLLAAADPAFAQAVLAREAELDAALDALPRVSAPAALHDRILASAPAPRRRWLLWLAPAGLGAALAGVATAGLLVGVQLSESSSVSPEVSAQAVADLDVSTVPEVG